MDKYFVDSDVILDFLIDRKPHAVAACHLVNMADIGMIKLNTSSIAISNVHYIARRIVGTKKSLQMLHELLQFVEVPSTGKKEVIEAMQSGFSDFEDGLQYATAKSIKGLKAIITRNLKDFKKSEIAVLDPDEWMKSF